jgi:hypothetical protein
MEAKSDDYIDWQQLVCLLCKRKFANSAQLQKHQKMSDLHKQNLEKERQKESLFNQQSFELQYRDRAKERRDKFGTDAIVPGWKKRFERERAKEIADSTSFEDHSFTENNSSSSDNIGSKLLKVLFLYLHSVVDICGITCKCSKAANSRVFTLFVLYVCLLYLSEVMMHLFA